MPNDGTKHSLEIERGAYRLADFAKGFELAHGACQFVGSFIQFFKQPHVLNRNHRLVSEGLEQHYLLFGKRPNLGAANMNRANRNVFTHQWYSQYGPNAYS